MKTRSLVLLAATLGSMAASCGGSSSQGRTGALAAGDQFVLVSVRLEDAMISPVKADGTSWDVAGPVIEPNARAEVIAAMDHAPDPKRAYEGAVAALGRIVEPWGRPDLAGKASFDEGQGAHDEQVFEGPADTFTPRLGVKWSHVPLSHWTTMHMYFVEKDPGGNQDIGAVVLSAHDLAKALEQHGRVHHVRIDDQTNGQMLYVGIVVTPEN